ncbi:hypothetical protein [Actinocrispum sp. NPDC049592]|uniref:hypothetical protein n=1 Tax=Actinocrispum sp. NPDC049592 TaxID=3154835 RepID=UPI00343F9C29
MGEADEPFGLDPAFVDLLREADRLLVEVLGFVGFAGVAQEDCHALQRLRLGEAVFDGHRLGEVAPASSRRPRWYPMSPRLLSRIAMLSWSGPVESSDRRVSRSASASQPHATACGPDRVRGRDAVEPLRLAGQGE